MNLFKRIALVLAALAVTSVAQADDRLKPFVLASQEQGVDFAAKVEDVKAKLAAAGFELVGEYKPSYGEHHVLAVTSADLKALSKKHERGGYAAAQRVSVSKAGNEVQVVYANPVYIESAYRLSEGDMASTAAKLKSALGYMDQFGSEKGLKAKQLEKYHYMMGMEYFDDVYKLGSYGSHGEAVAAVEKGLAAKAGGIGKIYRIDLPNGDTVFGVSMNAGENGNEKMDDDFQMGIVDFGPVKTAAYLPYEVLVKGKDVEALQMRFRMAVHFPDLKMMGDNSFMKLKKSPGAIEDALKAMLK